jgi:hypothetical protein
VLDRLPLLHPELLHEGGDPVRSEDPEEVVLEGQVEPGRPGVSLASRAAAELVVHPPGLVPLGADDVEPALPHHPLAELDVHAPPGHVRGDRHLAGLARLGDDLRLTLVVLGVQDVVGNAMPVEDAGEPLRLLDRDRPDEDRAIRLVKGAYLLMDGLELLFLGAVDLVTEVVPDHRLVRGDDHHVEVVDLLELHGLRVGGACHPRELLEHAEVVLERDRGEGLVLVLDLDAFFGLDGLVQAVRPAAPRHQSPREFVDDDHLAVLDHVVDVALEEDVGLQGLVHVVEDLDVARIVEVVHGKEALDLGYPLVLGHHDAARLLVDIVVLLLLEEADDRIDPGILVRRLFGRTGDDEGGPRLVDQDRVDLVHDRVVKFPLGHVLHAELHVVAQVVEAELVVRPVGDIAPIGGLPLLVVHPVYDHPYGQAEEPVNRPHPLRVPLRQIVVHGDEMDASARKGVQDDGKGGAERLPLAGPHLGDLPLVQHHSAHELDVEMPHGEDAFACLADRGEDLGEKVVHGLPFLQPLPELRRARRETIVRETGHRGLKGVDPVDYGPYPIQHALVVRAEHFLEEIFQHRRVPYVGCRFQKKAPRRGGAPGALSDFALSLLTSESGPG